MAVRDITELLRNIDLPTLRQFASETIIKAITSVVADHYEGQLCSILKQKYGAGYLTKSEIRLSILDGLTKDEAEALSVDVGSKPGATLNRALPGSAIFYIGMRSEAMNS